MRIALDAESICDDEVDWDGWARGNVVGDFRHRPAKFRRSLGLAAWDPQNREDFGRSAILTAGPALALSFGDQSRVSSSPLFDRVVAGSRAKRRPVV